MKRIFRWIFGGILLVLIFQVGTVSAASVPVHVFVREGCSHCAAEEEFLQSLTRERSDVDVIFHDIALASERETFDILTEKAGIPKATPVTFIQGIVIQGFATRETTGVRIRNAIDRMKSETGATLERFLLGEGRVVDSARFGACDETGATPCTAESGEYLIAIPFFGAVDLRPYSLPVIAGILGFVDGFNPCAMWVLVTFLLVLLQLGDKRKVWKIAGLFIVAETVMYYLILNVWLTMWDFIGLDRIITPIVGIVAIGGGLFFLYEGIMSDGTCKVTNMDQRRKIHVRIRDLASLPFTFATVLAVIGLALSVNIIEFACSIGIPQAFTKILDLNSLSFLGRQALMAVYILMYMVDDFIVFGLALLGTQHLALTHRYSRVCNVIGGILMALLGFFLILRPGALRFFS